LAIDCRTNYFAQGEAEKVAEKLRNRLGVCFDVILHDTHIHIEYDPT
jgi:aromatic ring-cleaving dioxygenase